MCNKILQINSILNFCYKVIIVTRSMKLVCSRLLFEVHLSPNLTICFKTFQLFHAGNGRTIIGR